MNKGIFRAIKVKKRYEKVEGMATQLTHADPSTDARTLNNLADSGGWVLMLRGGRV